MAGKRLYLFLDEIQEVPDWQKTINSLSVDIDCDIYLTGSSSNMLSDELATYIAGRYVHFTVYPFNFSEIKQYYKEKYGLPQTLPLKSTPSDEDLFEQYLQFGGCRNGFYWWGNSLSEYISTTCSIRLSLRTS